MAPNPLPGPDDIASHDSGICLPSDGASVRPLGPGTLMEGGYALLVILILTMFVILTPSLENDSAQCALNGFTVSTHRAVSFLDKRGNRPYKNRGSDLLLSTVRVCCPFLPSPEPPPRRVISV